MEYEKWEQVLFNTIRGKISVKWLKQWVIYWNKEKEVIFSSACLDKEEELTFSQTAFTFAFDFWTYKLHLSAVLVASTSPANPFLILNMVYFIHALEECQNLVVSISNSCPTELFKIMFLNQFQEETLCLAFSLKPG